MKVSVSPEELVVGEGGRVNIDCMVIGAIVKHVRWARDYGRLKKVSQSIKLSLLLSIFTGHI